MNMSNSPLILAAISLVAIIFTLVFGKKFDEFFARRKQASVLRRENAKPLLLVNWGTNYKVGKMQVVVWGSDFFQFAAQQAKKGSQGMYYAPLNMPAAVFTTTGYMPDGSLATGNLALFENAFQFYSTHVRVETRGDLFIPQMNEKYASIDWQKRHCGVISPCNWQVYKFFSPVTKSKAA